jgi:hypothetical protein
MPVIDVNMATPQITLQTFYGNFFFNKMLILTIIIDSQTKFGKNMYHTIDYIPSRH